MNSDREFTLIPFELPKSNSKINISGNIIRKDNKLNLAYLLQGNLSTIIIPEPSNLPTRKNELWQTTCFEFFLGIANSTQYWEFNLSPTGNWNVYRFSNYRSQMHEETAFTELPFTLNQQVNSLTINLEIDLNLITNSNTNLEIAITTVIKSSKGEISYWALHHPETIADFHNRDGFILHV
ncbi:MAG: DOMON-like domain-containing protein [Cyanobacteria bacterium P01_F01_bin.143]